MRDLDEVMKRVQMLPRVNITFFQDLLSLEPGERWERKLYEHIDDCDVFMLFWSTAAKESKWVRKEVEYALGRKGGDDSRPPEIVPILIEGPPVPLPPPELAHLHFNDRLHDTAEGRIRSPRPRFQITWRRTRSAPSPPLTRKPGCRGT
jgi:hypothetical protein